MRVRALADAPLLEAGADSPARFCAPATGTAAATASAVPVPSRKRRREIFFFKAASDFRPTIRRLTADFLNKLARAVGQAALLRDPAELLTYESDALVHLRATPGAVVLPASTADVQAVVRLCHEH